MTTETTFDVCIIGGGVVGLSVLRAATLRGWKCVLVEKEADLLSNASGSNSGIACTGVDALPGTLERALIRDAKSQMRTFLKQHNVPYRPCGSLVCQWPWDSNDQDKQEDDALDGVLEESHNAGDTHATRLDSQQVQQVEPQLAHSCQGAVHIPGEVVLDPWLYSIALAVHGKENGATIYTDFEFDAKESSWDCDTQTWTISRSHSSSSTTEITTPKFLKAKATVNAAGIYADLVQGGLADLPPHWTAQPRRGQYRVFSSTDDTRIVHPIQPVPTQRTKGIFVFSTLYHQIVVGPTALDQRSRTDRSVDPDVAKDLCHCVTRILPNLHPEEQYVGDYVGIRPGTKEYRDYQVRLYSGQHWIVAAGIRSTGLTASLGIGRHITHLLEMILPSPVAPENVQLTPLPSVHKLVEEFHSRRDGKVTIQGELYRVTHPITRLGWEARTGIAKS